MAQKRIIEARVRQKVDTYANWMANPLVLLDGEWATVRRGDGVVTNYRIGDGTKRFSLLEDIIQYDQSAYVAPEGNTLPAPPNGIGYSILTQGTYNGNLVVPAGNIGIASYSGSWSVRNMPLPTTPVVNSLTSTSVTDALSANQGRILSEGKVDKSTGSSLVPDAQISKLAALPTNAQLNSNFDSKENTSNKAQSIDNSASKYPSNYAVQQLVSNRLQGAEFGGTINPGFSFLGQPEKAYYFATPGVYNIPSGSFELTAPLSVVTKLNNTYTNTPLDLVVDKDMIVCETISEVRSMSAYYISLLQSGEVKGVTLLGYYQKGDTPHPIAYFLSNTTEADDGGSVIEVGGIKLVHDFKGVINPLYFGAQNGIIPASLTSKGGVIEITTDLTQESSITSFVNGTSLVFKGGALNGTTIPNLNVVSSPRGSAIYQRAFIKEINAVDYIDASVRSGSLVFLNRIIEKIKNSIVTQENRYNNNYVVNLTGSYSWVIEANTTTDVFNYMSIDGQGAVVIVQDYELNSTIPMIRTLQTPNGKNNRSFIKNIVFETRDSTVNNPIINIHSTLYITVENISHRNIGNRRDQIIIKQSPESYLDGIILRDIRTSAREVVEFPTPNILLYRGEGTVVENVGDGLTIYKQNGIISLKGIINPTLILINVTNFYAENMVRETGATYIYESLGIMNNVGLADNLCYSQACIVIDDERILQAYDAVINKSDRAIRNYTYSDVTLDCCRINLSSYYKLPAIPGYAVPVVVKKGENSILRVRENTRSVLSVYGISYGYNVDISEGEKCFSNNLEGMVATNVSGNNLTYNTGSYYRQWRPDVIVPDSLRTMDTGLYYLALDIFLNYKRKLAFTAFNSYGYSVSLTGNPSISTFGFRKISFSLPIKNVTFVAYLRPPIPNNNNFIKKSVAKMYSVDSEGMLLGYMPPNLLIGNFAEDTTSREAFNQCRKVEAISDYNIRAYLSALPSLGEWSVGDEAVIGSELYRYFNGSWVKII